MIGLESFRASEHYLLKQHYWRDIGWSFLVATALLFLLARFSPPYVPHPYQLHERVMTAVEFMEDFVVPPPPQEVQRPDLPAEAEISEMASLEETLAPTTYDPFAPPIVMSGQDSGIPETFVAYDTAPQVIHRVAPVYPDLARQAGAEGLVMVRVHITETGAVDAASVVQSEVLESMNQSACAAALQWLFSPAKQRDRAVAVWTVIPFRFSLN
ncbi:MAG: TonB family protein [Candidatus Nomurabacteria bacterium]|nr:MAG: TonB family protein [Candidatus Nomurabacteria bacterium]